jgi:dipeptidyl aminopeptidase/acylaminoacyl peptidase
MPPKKISKFNKETRSLKLSEVRIIQYSSNGWTIEALLVLPVDYSPGEKYPTLVYLHGGPESYVSASFTDLISARAQSAAHFLATQGYAVLLPNFRGSSGYGIDFEYELRDHQIMNNPFQDVMVRVDYLIEEGIADPEALGIYGTSFGGWLTAWAISQTSRFKGAVTAVGLYDILYWDRNRATAQYTEKPNRVGKADPEARWVNPEIYKQFSPMEHIRSINTPVLIIETSDERTIGFPPQARVFSHGLRALAIESYLAFYPKAFHTGGWNDAYKRDYMNRLTAWFNHCLKKAPLPDWFITP